VTRRAFSSFSFDELQKRETFCVQRVIKSNRPQKIMKTSTAAIFLAATAFAMDLVPSADAKLSTSIRGIVPSPSNRLAEEERELGKSKAKKVAKKGKDDCETCLPLPTGWPRRSASWARAKPRR
jgi:hypothetical protein